MYVKRQLYLDCDGVLADFDQHFFDCFNMTPRLAEEKMGKETFWNIIQFGTDDFYKNLPLMPGANDLFDAVEHLRPLILTGCPLGGWAEPQKVDWGRHYFPGTPVVTCMSRDKRDYCKPGDVLVDDRPHYKDLWEEAGGIFILHTSAERSISALRFYNIL